MDTSTRHDIPALHSAVLALHMLLSDPEPGLFTWQEAVHQKLSEITRAQLASEVDGLVDALRSEFTIGHDDVDYRIMPAERESVATVIRDYLTGPTPPRAE